MASAAASITAEWQPIETAPKDGTVVDLWLKADDGRDWRYTDCVWHDGKWYDEVGPGEPAWLVEQPWPAYDGEPPMLVASHWMPLPAPPVQS